MHSVSASTALTDKWWLPIKHVRLVRVKGDAEVPHVAEEVGRLSGVRNVGSQTDGTQIHVEVILGQINCRHKKIKMSTT